MSQLFGVCDFHLFICVMGSKYAHCRQNDHLCTCFAFLFLVRLFFVRFRVLAHPSQTTKQKPSYVLHVNKWKLWLSSYFIIRKLISLGVCTCNPYCSSWFIRITLLICFSFLFFFFFLPWMHIVIRLRVLLQVVQTPWTGLPLLLKVH